MTGLLTTASLDGVRVATSRHLATNATVLSAGRDVLIVDAPYYPDELAELSAFARATDARLFATHSHFDHLMGRYAFPAATLLIGRATAETLAGDPARPTRELIEEDARSYVRRSGPLLFGALQGVAVPGWIELGPHDIELVDAAGHAADGTALWAPWAQVLCCGDYLSDVEIPLVSSDGSIDAYRATLERLAPYVEQARLVVPGHGMPCAGPVARRRLEADLRYLEAVAAGAGDDALPAGRDSARQREIHRANSKRHGPGAKQPADGASGKAAASGSGGSGGRAPAKSPAKAPASKSSTAKAKTKTKTKAKAKPGSSSSGRKR